jgi:hypothetical protein
LNGDTGWRSAVPKKGIVAAPCDEDRAVELALGRYEPDPDDPLAAEHRRLNDLAREVAARPPDPVPRPEEPHRHLCLTLDGLKGMRARFVRNTTP